MKSTGVFQLTFLFILICCGACSVGHKSLVNEVNPFVGTGFHGHTYPGATVPFGAVQLSPDTRRGNWDACAGYHYSDTTILGFSHTHLSGTGCIDLGDILFYPSSHELFLNDTSEWMHPLPFSHQEEWAGPGYYSVMLPTEQIRVELTSTPYVGVHRYRFGKTGRASIVIDPAHLLDNEQIKLAALEQTAPQEICGMRCTQGWVDNQYVYFVARFSRPFDSLTWVRDGEVCVDSERVTGEKLQAIPSFQVEEGTAIEVQVGLSLVSIENARMNLEHDLHSSGFDQVRKKATVCWQQSLSDIMIEGGTSAERLNFYTALYHCRIVPNVVSDVNGEYRRPDMSIGRTQALRKHYSTFSFWDTFRTWHPLMTLLDTTLVTDMIHSALDFYGATGELPVWPLSSGETGTMIGYHAVSVIADAWMKGIRGFDGKKALEAMVRSAEKNKKGAEYYICNGYIPADMKKESVSCLLEFAYDDWAISRMAADLEEIETADCFARRAQNYRNVFDGSTLFFRGKRLDGNWESPFDPYEIGRSYTEANAWQYRFFVPHDVNGMIQLYGGREVFLRELDRLFSTTSELKGKLVDITGLIGQYAQGNEPSHHMAYLYNYAGQPWKTQEMTRRILKEMYQPNPEGICGNEDCGQMSAWYVMTALGIYPVCPGSNEFLLTSPLFPKATIALGNGRKLVITANQPEQNHYIQKVWLNGKELKRCFVTYDELMQGGVLKFQLSSTPDREWGVSDVLPYSYSQCSQVSVPYVLQDLNLFEDSIRVELGSATEGAQIRYTLDGTVPDLNSPVYQEPIWVEHSCVLKARGFKEGYTSSEILVLQATRAEYHVGRSPVNVKNGTKFSYYEGEFNRVQDMESLYPVAFGFMPEPSILNAPVVDHFGYIWEGLIYVPVRGVYGFGTRSDDGSVLVIDGRKVVDNDGSHGAVFSTGRIALDRGWHAYRLLFFEDYEGQMLEWFWKVPGKEEYELIPASVLFVE